MLKFKSTTLLSLIGLLSLAVVASARLPQASLQLITQPPLDQLVPFDATGETAQSAPILTLQLRDAAGQPLPKAKVHLQLFAPSHNPWFSTDFPVVEGTQLLELTAETERGELQLQQMLPIRGNYRLAVEVLPVDTDAFAPIAQTLTLRVSEHSNKYRNFAILAVMLWLVGLGGGWLIGKPQVIQPGEIAPQSIRLLLSAVVLVAIVALLVVNISAELAESHAHHHEHSEVSSAQIPQGIAQSQGLEVRIIGDTQATVGQLAQLQIQAIDQQTGQPATDLAFQIQTRQLEENWLAFAYTGTPDPAGQLAWRQQFFDGAPHRLEVTVLPQSTAGRQFKPFKVVQEIEAEGVAPPLLVRLIALGYFTSIVLLGLVMGLWLQRRQSWAQAQGS
ncbi:hypothetical protein [Leptolyngbya sp. FACHB-261]|uniref:hypothetical protein n=1 Tax=Leptolyngbya sp. FACHB-261 TaxID=2692806 RepID=UPI0016878A50|nr:hypothetical protein [Leptolyngbya sp. FACHB-261]MBD2103546.1 hypothetical protein [Leptolyngbya sp. FACHB-261]